MPGFTKAEWEAMAARAEELKAEASSGRKGNRKAKDEVACLDAIAGMDPEDKAVGVSHYLDAILINGAWKVRGENPQAWAAEYRRALEQAPAGTLCTVWDVFPRR